MEDPITMDRILFTLLNPTGTLPPLPGGLSLLPMADGATPAGVQDTTLEEISVRLFTVRNSRTKLKAFSSSQVDCITEDIPDTLDHRREASLFIIFTPEIKDKVPIKVTKEIKDNKDNKDIRVTKVIRVTKGIREIKDTKAITELEDTLED